MDATQERWRQDLVNANVLILKLSALIKDGDFVGLDPTNLPSSFTDYYKGLTSIGYANGWVA